jgi:hypothetical protein
MVTRDRDLVDVVFAEFATMPGLENLDADSDFRKLGRHLLMAVRQVAGLRGHAAIRLTVRDVFKAPAPAALGLRDGFGDAG